MNEYILVECTNHDQIYGIIKSDLDNHALQEEIYNEKRKYPNADYTIECIVYGLNQRGFNVEFVQAENDKKVEI